MPEQKKKKQAPALEEVKAGFEAWRNAGNRRRPIPERLWQLAVELSPRYPASKISRVLRLDYYGLKKRIENANENLPAVRNESPAVGKTAFVELDFGASFPASVCECKIAMKSSDGSEMKIDFKGDRCGGPIELCRIFWSRGL